MLILSVCTLTDRISQPMDMLTRNLHVLIVACNYNNKYCFSAFVCICFEITRLPPFIRCIFFICLFLNFYFKISKPRVLINGFSLHEFFIEFVNENTNLCAWAREFFFSTFYSNVKGFVHSSLILLLKIRHPFSLSVCVCVCVCTRARACVHVCRHQELRETLVCT